MAPSSGQISVAVNPMRQDAVMMAMMGHGASTSGAPWPSAAAGFVTAWTAMMLMMMLPSLWPTLRRYRGDLDARGASRPGLQTAVAGIGYTGMWAAIGLIVFVLDATIGTAATRSPAVARLAPLAAGGVFLVAGALQLTRWKAHRLAQCRTLLRGRDGASISKVSSAWRDGIRLGARCSMSCAGPMAILLVVGMMDVRAMAVITAAITGERIGPAGTRVARATGAMALGAGVVVLARAIRAI